tara:strand:+ start:131 stop:316 length:186 start_codon:yes stop_codon:yes gene_type:complete
MAFTGDFQAQLDRLLKEAKEFDLEVVCEWGDEYGGKSSVTLINGDRIYFREIPAADHPKNS